MHLPWREVAPGSGPAIPTSITEAEATRLRELAADADVLEVGSAYGFSTVLFGLVAKSVVAVDPHVTHNSLGVIHAHLAAYGVHSRVLVAPVTSQQALPQYVQAGLTYDLIFIDGDHTAAGVESDLTHALELVRPGGAIAVHDVTEACCCPDVGPTLDRVLRARPYEVELNADGRMYELVDTLAVVTA